MTKSQSKLSDVLLRGFLILACVWCSITYTQAQPNQDTQQHHYPAGSAQAWLSKMVQAINGLNYQVSFVLLKPGVDTQPYLWRHGINSQGVEVEQLNLLNGPGIEMLRVDDQVSYFEPNVPPYSLKSNVINGPLPIAFFSDPLSLSESYDFYAVGRSRISGRAAQQIRIVSKDKSRFGFNLWLDQETGLLLKLNIVDLKGKLLEQIQVTEFVVTEEIHPYLDRIEVSKLPKVVSLGQSAQSAKKWQIEFMPVGMKLIKWDVHRLPIGDPVDYVMLSDGLVDVSVYLQRVSNLGAESDLLFRHESNTFLTRQLGGVQVTVIGKLPPQTAHAIASSISLVN